MVTATLREMAKGGMYDHLGGGFHRYSVDAHWFVPHFEKMLYDQAQLAISYLEAFQITGDGCSNTSIAPGNSCQIGLRYNEKVSETNPVATLRIASASWLPSATRSLSR